MSQIIDAQRAPAMARRIGDALAQVTLRRALPLLLVFIAGIVLRHFVLPNWDVSWLLTVGEKMLAGERFGSDILEVNPPASPLLYMPAILIARVLGITPEFTVDALVFIGIGVSLALCARTLANRKLFAIDGWALAAITAAVLAVLPAFSFSQREHIAVIALLPLLTVLALRAKGETPHLSDAIIAGLGAGIAVTIKPYFVGAVVLPALAAALSIRSWRVVFALEDWIAAGIAVVYAASIFVFFPDFITRVMPMAGALYFSDRLPLFAALMHPATLVWLATLVCLAVLKRRAVIEPPFSILICASAGFAIAFVIQGKGWPYHAYPMFALAFIAVGAAYARTDQPIASMTARRKWLRIAASLALAVIVAKVGAWFNQSMDTRVLAAAIEKIHPHPRMHQIGDEIVLSHPLVRQIRGQWVGSVFGQWITSGILRARERGGIDAAHAAELERYAAFDRAVLANDIRTRRPDILLIDRRDFDWQAWAYADPAVAAALAPYRPVETIEGIVILHRDAG